MLKGIQSNLDYPNPQTPEPKELQGQSTKLKTCGLFVCGVHCRAAAVHEQWPPELILALKEAKSASKWFCQSRELSKCSISVVLAWLTVEFQLSELFAYPNP